MSSMLCMMLDGFEPEVALATVRLLSSLCAHSHALPPLQIGRGFGADSGAELGKGPESCTSLNFPVEKICLLQL